MGESPIKIFGEWFEEAKNSGLKEPTAFSLATATPEGRPSCRIVLLKKFDESGFSFFTNSESRKGGELTGNPQAAACFYWMDLSKQIRIEGQVQEIIGAEADEYYQSRAVISKLGAWASKQSQILPDRQELLDRLESFRMQYGENPPRPPHWHGYRIVPQRIEFWQEVEFRLHERSVFEREGSAWKEFRLYP